MPAAMSTHPRSFVPASELSARLRGFCPVCRRVRSRASDAHSDAAAMRWRDYDEESLATIAVLLVLVMILFALTTMMTGCSHTKGATDKDEGSAFVVKRKVTVYCAEGDSYVEVKTDGVIDVEDTAGTDDKGMHFDPSKLKGLAK